MPSMWGVHGFQEEGPELRQVIGKTIIPRGAKKAYSPNPLENVGGRQRLKVTAAPAEVREYCVTREQEVEELGWAGEAGEARTHIDAIPGEIGSGLL